MDDGRLEAEHGKLDYRDSTDDEEVRLLPHRKGADEPDPPGSEIRDGPNTSDTQQDEWLLKTVPLQGARLKWNKGERPPVMADWTTPLLPLERQILQEAEVTTPPRGGGELTGLGSSGSLASVTPRMGTSSFMDVRTRDVGSDRRNDTWSPGNVLVIRTENRWCVPLDRRLSQRRKCHGLVGRPVGNSTDRFLTQ